MDWARILTYITGTVDQELLLRNEYLVAENRILKAQIKIRLRLTDAERVTLAEIAHRLGCKALGDVANAAKPDTIMGWYRRLVARKFDGSKSRRYPGRPRIDDEIEQWVVRMAKENSDWGYDRIVGAMANLGYKLSDQAVGNILRGFLDQRVRDGVIRRAIGKWLNAGVMESGEVSHPERGTPQGGVVSPLLSNLYLHVVLDEWFEHDVKPRLRGQAFEIRFADDAALVFEREEDARRVLAVLSKRFAKYGLRLHPEKTRLVDFRSPPRAEPSGSPSERSFALLGFTHFWGRSRKGRWVVQRKTAKDRFTRALRELGCWCRAHRHWPVAAQQAALRRKLQGHYAYYGITGNARALGCFLYEVRRLWRKWLDRRSWHARMTWEKFVRLSARYPLPQPRVVHSLYRRAATP